MRRAATLGQGLLVLGLAAFASVAPVGCVGVGDARYVYQDGQFGVVGIPSNTAVWPHDYRAQAEELMRAHFPEGYAIVRAEEVVEGSRTLVLDGKTTAEVAPCLPSPLGRLATLGRTNGRTQSDSLKIKECRVLYKKASETDTPEGFAAVPDLDPLRYRAQPGEVSAKDDPGKSTAQRPETSSPTR